MESPPHSFIFNCSVSLESLSTMVAVLKLLFSFVNAFMRVWHSCCVQACNVAALFVYFDVFFQPESKEEKGCKLNMEMNNIPLLPATCAQNIYEVMWHESPFSSLLACWHICKPDLIRRMWPGIDLCKTPNTYNTFHILQKTITFFTRLKDDFFLFCLNFLNIVGISETFFVTQKTHHCLCIWGDPRESVTEVSEWLFQYLLRFYSLPKCWLEIVGCQKGNVHNSQTNDSQNQQRKQV